MSVIKAGSTGLIKHEDYLYPVIDKEKADALSAQINWDNYIDEEKSTDEEDKYYPIESVFFNKCSWASEINFVKDEDTEDADFTRLELLTYAKAYEDDSLLSMLDIHTTEEIDWCSLSTYFSDLSIAYTDNNGGIAREIYADYYERVKPLKDINKTSALTIDVVVPTIPSSPQP